MTAQFSASKGRQVASSIDEELRIGDIMILGKGGIGTPSSEIRISDVRTRATTSLTPRGQSRSGVRPFTYVE